MVSDFDESKVKFEGLIDRYVKNVVLGKVIDIKDKIIDDVIIILVDIIVILEDKLFGKLKDEEDVFKMIKLF